MTKMIVDIEEYASAVGSLMIFIRFELTTDSIPLIPG